jgi:hypothetical protein
MYSQSWSGTAGTCPILLITAPPKKLANILLAQLGKAQVVETG